jgi:hypothetical protein
MERFYDLEETDLHHRLAGVSVALSGFLCTVYSVIGSIGMMAIRLDIPALSELVAYLRGNDASQKDINALAARVDGIRIALKRSADDLESSLPKGQ